MPVIKRLVPLCFMSIAASQCANAQAPFENIEEVRSKVAQFLTDEYTKTEPVKLEVKVGRLDNRLRLSQCNQNLSMVLKDTNQTGGNINVRVACSGNTPWAILVPAMAKIYRSVAVAGRNLQRGELVTLADLTQETKDLSEYRLGFTLAADTIIGKELKYSMNKGEVFRNSALSEPLVIRRGDTVSMESSVGDISVRTRGTAVSDGRLGQQIRVKNNQSARIVNVKVVGAGRVQGIL